MNDQERRGRTLILVVALGLVASAVLELLVALATPALASTGLAWLRLGLCLLFSFLMWQGYSWARPYIAFLLFVGAVLAALGSLVALIRSPIAGLVGLAFAAFYGWGGWVLWKSPHVDAYIEYREKLRIPDMSLGGGLGS